jgi:hypothetical protein
VARRHVGARERRVRHGEAQTLPDGGRPTPRRPCASAGIECSGSDRRKRIDAVAPKCSDRRAAAECGVRRGGDRRHYPGASIIPQPRWRRLAVGGQRELGGLGGRRTQPTRGCRFGGAVPARWPRAVSARPASRGPPSAPARGRRLQRLRGRSGRAGGAGPTAPTARPAPSTANSPRCRAEAQPPGTTPARRSWYASRARENRACGS